ncbi:MAG: prepilin-type N-terminal cleavage/methylation domain-containing protein [Coxiellaceae bacterium]|nr:MAG: prepilin-type N-terminal cleavage/methylation domain-containing protein [Coxiellaceae bacterium]
MKSRKGIGLLELMLSLAIISVIIIMATRYYDMAHLSRRVNDTVSMIQTLRSASERWLVSHPDYADISVENLQERNLLPSDFGKNPFGGDITIESGNDANNQIEITVTKIPVTACKTLLDRFKSVGTSPDNTCAGSSTDLVDYVVVF